MPIATSEKKPNQAAEKISEKEVPLKKVAQAIAATTVTEAPRVNLSYQQIHSRLNS